jgi:16S rRNA (cytosine967-C5)-methyltransferase
MIAPARAAALSVLRAVAAERGDLGGALTRAKQSLSHERDRALAAELAMGVLRHRAALDYQLSQRLSRPLARLDPEVRDILRLAAFQLLHLNRVPAAAIVNDAVAQTRRAGKSSAAALVNAVLRRLARERGSLSWPAAPMAIASRADYRALVEHLSIVHSHPDWLVSKWLERYGRETTEAWLAFDNVVPPLTLAVNTARATREVVEARLEADGVETNRTRVSPAGLTVRHGRALDTQAFHDGLFLVQDEASQIIPLLVDAQPGHRVLDACAAPGGKTVALAAQVGPRGLIVATDVRARRMGVLARTLDRARVQRAWPVQVSPAGPWPFPTGTFDRILVDAPCSGLGTLRRDPDIRWRREPVDLSSFADAQLALVAAVAPLVAPGGRLVYSTCSSEPEENEDVVGRFLVTHPRFRVRPLDTIEHLPAAVVEMSTPEGFLRTLPNRDGLEAFFGAALDCVD